MGPFRWPSTENDIALAREVAASRPEKPNDWDGIATRLSEHFSTDGKPVELKARGCRERMDRLLSKYKQEDAKSLKRSGAEEDYNELKQLLEDISTFRRDMMVLKDKEKEEKRNQAENGKRKAEMMRRAVMERRRETYDDNQDSIHSSEEESEDEELIKKMVRKDSKSNRPRLTKLTAMEMLANKYEKKAELKEKELEIRKMELELNTKKHESEVQERQRRLEVELEERRAMLGLVLSRSNMQH
ncbi:Hypothetical predicted protein [Paramuricea clavata]|uniref:Uncharacterized protein n=1 Tax=Paramuricea clavata TaxID=317549 RepID=A0A6S7GC77_PARCT|nr:Hypothetical predicted protein [Paramuricea clavata]